MNEKEILNSYLKNDFEIDAKIGETLIDAAFRNSVYSLIPNFPSKDYQNLLTYLFELEIRDRNGELEVNSKYRDEDYFENIYLCGFLLSKIGDPKDVFTIWKAHMLDMDIGCLNAHYFVGAGLEETIKYLDSLIDETSRDIKEYILEELTGENAEYFNVESWERGMLEYHQR